ncbi:protein TonB [Methylohalomonas lacus]|uniref:Protein TonB n=1 Tax=Methylohalomonas lacus TaxID=398773 RepID=A0AAE3HIR6_9GAMM|nr:energy transducer TonB [Methylohalomonas lacus]MCS3902555.1 protein TonB [Methylohalomonas lacus]
MSLRFPLIIIAAVILNLLLFYFIQELVSGDQDGMQDYEDVQFVDFVRMREEEPEPEPERKEEEPPEPPDEPEPQQQPEMAEPEAPEPQQQAQPSVSAPNIDIPMGIDGVPYVGDFMKSPTPEPQKPDTSGVLTDIQPTSKVPPQYPPRALRSGIEGSVTVEFTITTDGTVKDPEIVAADPEHIFNDAVLRSIRRWKFEKQRVDGEVVERRARQVVRFKLQ